MSPSSSEFSHKLLSNILFSLLINVAGVARHVTTTLARRSFRKYRFLVSNIPLLY
jgi:hypothetical protein